MDLSSNWYVCELPDTIICEISVHEIQLDRRDLFFVGITLTLQNLFD